MPFVREIPLAHELGYTEVEDFRRAVAAGQIPAPHHYLGPRKKRPIWDREAIDAWLGIAKKNSDRDDFLSLVDQVA